MKTNKGLPVRFASCLAASNDSVHFNSETLTFENGVDSAPKTEDVIASRASDRTVRMWVDFMMIFYVIARM